MTHSIAPLLKRFFSHYLPIQRKLSINTILAYRDATKLLLCYAAETLKHSVDKLDVEDITEKTVLGFLDSIEQERGCTANTRNARLAAIRSLFAFIAREEPVLVEQCQQVRSIPLKRTRHKSIDYLKEEEMQAVLDAVDINSRTGIRDKALLMLLYNTGARVSEIIGIELTDLQLNKAPQVKLHGKGNKDRSCPLWSETVTALNAYIRQRTPKDPETKQIFLNANRGPITRFGIRHVTRKYGFLAQVKQPALKAKPLNPHRIRHTTAMHLLHANNEITMISYWLGHAVLNTTHMYVEIDMEMKRKMLETVDAPKDKSKPPWKKPSMLRWLEKLTQQPELCAVN
ncbi:MAG: tyrosine-type recombinase/integrase [Kiritimatiellae bacterium]|jgi:integrase/recombinase XerD|nr:tyrosine-type recombinase/integrase [Kiritimatiellia bacterium]